MSSKKKICFVFARGGSKGLVNKNIRVLNGMPLIAYSLTLAKSINQIDEIFVSTDSLEIASVAKCYGVNVIPRPSELSQDNSSEWLAWRHAINWTRNNVGDFSCFISLPATAPLRKKDDVCKCIDALNKDTDIVITMTESHRSPWFNMVRENENNFIELLINNKTKNIVRRQDAPKSFDMTTVAYVTRPDFVASKASFWEGNVKGVFIPKERAIDIDDEFDLKLAEFLIMQNNKNELSK